MTPAVPWQNSSDTAKHAGDEDDIHEAIIRRQVERWYHEETTAKTSDATKKSVAEALTFKVIFVEIDERDPNKEFLKRLRDIPRIIKKKSASQIHRVSVAWLVRHPRPILDIATVVDKATRHPLVRNAIVAIDSKLADVDMGTYIIAIGTQKGG